MAQAESVHFRAFNFSRRRAARLKIAPLMVAGVVEDAVGLVVLFEGQFVIPFGVLSDIVQGEADIFLAYPAPGKQ